MRLLHSGGATLLCDAGVQALRMTLHGSQDNQHSFSTRKVHACAHHNPQSTVFNTVLLP